MFVLYNFRTQQGLKHSADPFVLYIGSYNIIIHTCIYVYTRYLSISKEPNRTCCT